MTAYIGIDPGWTGGLALIVDKDDLEQPLVVTVPMPPTLVEILNQLEAWVITAAAKHIGLHATLEQVHGFPGMNVSSVTKFMKQAGAVEMALVAAKIPHDLVIPSKWQTLMQCRSGGDKNVTKRRAQQLFPGRHITHATADALLLAEYGRRLHRGIFAAQQRRRQHE